MFKQKRGVELTTNTIILLVITVLVLAIIVLFSTGALGDLGNQIFGKIKWAFGLWPKSPTG